MREGWLVVCPVTSLRVGSVSSTRGEIQVIEIGGLCISGGSGSLINLAIQFPGATSANEAGKEEKYDNEGDDTSDRKDRGNRACIVEETKIIVSKSSQVVIRRKGKSFSA